MQYNYIIQGSILALLAVVLGAFAAHALEEVLSPSSLDSFKTGVRYQFYHAFALILCGVIAEKITNAWIRRSASLFLIGTILFSGSIYALTLRSVLGMDFLRMLGPVTPIGGSLLIIGWSFFLLAALNQKRNG